jgi:hypothetical protein
MLFFRWKTDQTRSNAGPGLKQMSLPRHIIDGIFLARFSIFSIQHLRQNKRASKNKPRQAFKKKYIMVHHHHGRRLLNINSSSTIWRSRGFSSRPQRDFFADLRLRVAKALTDSLHPDDVRRELLGVSGQTPQQQQAQAAVAAAAAVQSKVAEEPVSSSSLSIAETIAAVREEESRKFAAKWEREKDIIMAEAERAVRARLESDLVLKQRQMAFEKWKQGVESEKRTKTNEVVVVEIPTTPASTMPVSSIEQKQQREDEEEGAIEEQQQQQQQEDFTALSTHPILGQCIADLGYKRLHLISIEKLIHIPVWEKQRIYRHDRAVQMAKDKRKTLHLGLPGVMGIHENTVTGELRILDGQHRIGMLAILLMLEGSKKQQQHGEEDKSNTASDGSTISPLQDKPIVVEVYPSAEPQSAKELFTEINRAEPVKLVDMPGVLKDSSRHILNEAAGQLRDLYPEMFKPSQRCRPPHLNIDNLREALFVASVLDRHQIKNATALLDWMRAENEKLRQEYQKENVRSRVPEKVMEKADANQFYLGLESTWYTK